MSDLRELYQEVILDHNRHPRNFHIPKQANVKADGFNPLCGDRISVYLELEEGKVKEVGFQGEGCAISKASGSMMTSIIKGKDLKEVDHLYHQFHHMITGAPGAPLPEGLGKLAVFSGVCEFPSRVKCASLCWHTLRAAMEGKPESGKGEIITTEEEMKSD